LKNRPHVIENPAALNLGGGFRAHFMLDKETRVMSFSKEITRP
jgi:hypothetical protein